MTATGSVPSTPQMGRRKLDLLPRSGAPSVQPSPLSSPKSASHNTVPRSSPFGAAKYALAFLLSGNLKSYVLGTGQSTSPHAKPPHLKK